jgi:ABC-2 type transport system permease protein
MSTGTGTGTGTATRALFVNEARLMLRTPAAVIWPVLFPVIGVIVIAAIPAARRPFEPFGGFSVAQVYIPVLLIVTLTSLALTYMPQLVGSYRELGVLKRLRTTPASPGALLTAIVGLMAAVSTGVALTMVLIPAALGVGLPGNTAVFALMTVLSMLSFLALGAMLSAVIPSSRVASGVGSAVAMTMWFAAGLWYPRAQFPDWLLAIADLTPGGAAARGMLDATYGASVGWQPIAVLVGWTLLGVAVAVRTFRWE